MYAELHEIAFQLATRKCEHASEQRFQLAARKCEHATGVAGGALLCMPNDMLLSILDQLRLSRDVASIVACLASSRSLSCISREFLREHYPLSELLPELLALPAHLQAYVSERCRTIYRSLGRLPGGLLRGSLYAAVQQLLYRQPALPLEVVWLVVQQWGSTLEDELSSIERSRRRWRIGFVGMARGRHYRLGGLDDKGASEHYFRCRGEEASVAEYFAEKRRQPLRRPELPCILAGPCSAPGLIRLPMELLTFEAPDDAADISPRPEEIAAMPPALRALAEYISREAPA